MFYVLQETKIKKNGHMLYCLSFVCMPSCKILANDILCGTVMCLVIPYKYIIKNFIGKVIFTLKFTFFRVETFCELAVILCDSFLAQNLISVAVQYV